MQTAVQHALTQGQKGCLVSKLKVGLILFLVGFCLGFGLDPIIRHWKDARLKHPVPVPAMAGKCVVASGFINAGAQVEIIEDQGRILVYESHPVCK